MLLHERRGSTWLCLQTGEKRGALLCQPTGGYHQCQLSGREQLLNGVHFCIGLQFSKGMSPLEKCGRKQMPFGSPREVSCTFRQVSDLISQRSFKWGETRVLISASLSTCSQV